MTAVHPNGDAKLVIMLWLAAVILAARCYFMIRTPRKGNRK